MNKFSLRDTMLVLTEAELAQATSKYEVFLNAAKLDRFEPVENDEQAQAETAAVLAKAFDDQVHGRAEKIERLNQIDFGDKDEVTLGAVVQVGDRYLVVSVSTAQFDCAGKTFMGISPQAPVYSAMEGKKTGETCTFNGRDLTIGAIH